MPTTISFATREIASPTTFRESDISGVVAMLALTAWAFAMLFIVFACSGLNSYVESLPTI